MSMNQGEHSMKNLQLHQLDKEQLAILGAAFAAGYSQGASGGNASPPTHLLPDNAIPPSKHRVPGMPTSLDGKAVHPESVKDFDGRPLFYVLDAQAAAGEVLPIFSDRQKALHYCEKTTPTKAALEADAEHTALATHSRNGSITEGITEGDPFIGAVRLFEHINFQGGLWDMYAMNGNVPDFRSVFCFLWWCQNINDRISSVDNQCVAMAVYRPRRAFTVLHEHINFAGSELMIVERQTIASLVPLGWNDRASSVSFRLV
jgi:hypothetical protein